MDSLLKSIIEVVTRAEHRLSVISCPDGFLQREDTIHAFADQAGITVLHYSQLELRVWYETEFIDSGNKRFIIILDSTQSLLADIRNNAFVSEFKTRDLLLTYNQQAIDLGKMNYQMMAHLFENKSVAAIMDRTATSAAVNQAETKFGQDGDDVSVVKHLLMDIVTDWQHPLSTIEQLSQQVVKVARQDKVAEIENELAFINQSFQQYLDTTYAQLVSASSPKVVHKILPYISRTYGIGQKVALVVADGLSYWQYIVLRQKLNEVGITTEDNVCYAWIPSVTMLSRQAIFKGDRPDMGYHQNPTNEEKLWRNYWYGKNFKEWHVMYAYEELPPIDDAVERLAYVTMVMDDDMHSAHSMKQLYSSTVVWADKFTPIIQQILKAGFDIILTADHGGVPSHGWGNLTQHEKVALYETGSRGQRHLIFSSQSAQQHFLDSHPDTVPQWRILGNSVVWRDNKCFGTNDCISHGGSHVLEMLVPLITIKCKQ